MADSFFRVDPVTGLRVSFFDVSGKPAARQKRTFPESEGSCSFCEMAAQAQLGSASVWSGNAPRPVTKANEFAFVIPNRWSAFGAPPQGFAELVVPYTHYITPQKLTPQEWHSFLSLSYARYETRRKNFNYAYSSINVGCESGASMAHLHCHVVGSRDAFVPSFTQQALTEDLEKAKREALLLPLENGDRGEKVFVYVPWAPAFDGEVRVQARNAESLIVALGATIRKVEEVGLEWAYNVLISYDFNFAQICFRAKPLDPLGMINGFRVNSMLPGEFKKTLLGTSVGDSGR